MAPTLDQEVAHGDNERMEVLLYQVISWHIPVAFRYSSDDSPDRKSSAYIAGQGIVSTRPPHQAVTYSPVGHGAQSDGIESETAEVVTRLDLVSGPEAAMSRQNDNG